MTTLKDIEIAIGKLTPLEYEELRRWFDQNSRLQPADAQLKSRLDAGHFDTRIDRALADHKAGRTRVL